MAVHFPLWTVAAQSRDVVVMDRQKEIVRVTLWGSAVNIILAAVKLAAGIIGRSSAMIADALHSLTDLLSDVVVLVMVRISSRSSDRGHEYGHGKFETLATVFVSLLLLAVGVKMVVDGIGQVWSVVNGGTLAVPGRIAFVVALLSVALKEILYQWTAAVGKRCDSPATVTNAWHHRTDALSSVAAALGIGLARLLGGKWAVLDPLTCCGISLFIFYVAIKMAVPALNELTEAALPEETESRIRDILGSIEGIENVHALKTRRNGRAVIVEAHVVVDPGMTVLRAHALTEIAEDALRAELGDQTQISLHVEPSVDSK